MKLHLAVLSASLCVAGSAFGQGKVDAKAAEALAMKSGCIACHAVDKKLIGPSYKDVANKYRGDATAPAKLAEKVKKGGSGVWGPVPMPPNPNAKDDDVKKMVQLILNLKK